MKNTIVTALLLSLASVAAPQEPTYRVVVGLKDRGERDFVARMADIDASQRRVGRLMDGRNGRLSRVYSLIPAFSAEVTREGWAALAADPDVAKVDLDESAQVAMTTVNAVVHSVEVQTLGLTGKGVTVAVIDTGIDSSHPDLAGAIIDEACFCVDATGRPCCPNGTSRQFGPGSAKDEHGHGTHLAGIIAGRGRVAPRGLAPDASLISIKVAGASGSTSTSSILAALDWLMTSRPDVRVVNISLATSTTYTGSCDSATSVTSAFATAARNLKNRGAVVVAAAGNSGLTDKMAAPACASGFLAVGAVYAADEGAVSANGCTDAITAADRVACFSNSSATLGILAPGTGIISTGLGGGQAIASGTSQAAAVVSGAAALLMESTAASGGLVDTALRTGIVVTDNRNHRVTPRLDARAALTALTGL
jgi:subtilisin family serine protease